MERPLDDPSLADRLNQAAVSTSCCWQGIGKRDWSVGPLREPRRCDLVLVEVIELGYDFGDGLLEVIGESGAVSVVPIEVGTVFVCSFGDREADDEWTALLPERFAETHPTLDLAAGCGLISLVQESRVGRPPTRVRVLGAIHAAGAPVTTLVERMVRPEPSPDSTTVLFVADKMNAGKSTAVLACTHALSRAKETVAVGKVTGTARRRALAPMLEARARVAQSFVDFGYASTKNIPADDLMRLLDGMRAGLSAEAAGGYVLLELADGFEQAETKAVLKRLRERPVDRTVLCLSGSESPARTVERYTTFCAEFGAPDMISGYVATQPDHVAALRNAPGAAKTPLFDAVTAHPGELAQLLTGTKT